MDELENCRDKAFFKVNTAEIVAGQQLNAQQICKELSDNQYISVLLTLL